MFRTTLLLVIASSISVHGFAMDLQGEGRGNKQQQLGLSLVLREMIVLETPEDDMESRIFTSGGGLNLNSTTLTLLGK